MLSSILKNQGTDYWFSYFVIYVHVSDLNIFEMINKINFSQGYATTDSHPRWRARSHEAGCRYVRRAQRRL